MTSINEAKGAAPTTPKAANRNGKLSSHSNNSTVASIVQKDKSGEAFTTSLLIAEKFNKRHDTVLRKIQKLPDDEFSRRNFAVANYIDDQGKPRTMFQLTRDGFSYVAMSFTGNEAHIWKVRFIDAFNKMEQHLHNIVREEWLEHRAEAALEHRTMCRTLDEVRKLDGKETKFFHYANESKLVNWALTGEFKKLDRDSLTDDELGILTTLEAYNAVLIGAGHDRNARKVLLKNRCQEAMGLLLEAA